MRCLVAGCRSNSARKDVSMHRIPVISSSRSQRKVNKSRKRREKWLQALKQNRADLNEYLLKYGRICGKHSISGKPAGKRQSHHPDWVPSLLLDQERSNSDVSSSTVDLGSPETNSAESVLISGQDVEELSSGTLSAEEGVEKLSSGTLSAEEHAEELSSGTVSTVECCESLSSGTLSAEECSEKLSSGTRSADECSETLSSETLSAEAHNNQLSLGTNFVEVNNEVSEEHEFLIQDHRESADCETQTNLTDIEDKDNEVNSLRGVVKSLKDDVLNLQKEMQCLRDRTVSRQAKLDKLLISPDSFKGNDSKTKYFTGLPTHTVLMSVFDLLAPFIQCHAHSSLNKFQCFILTLMRLRLNVPFKELAYRFDVSPTTVSSKFYSCLNVMYSRLRSFVRWPSREELICIIPQAFRDIFGEKVAVVIDCFEIPIEEPSNLSASAECWSNYKQRHTVKYLTGITPQGAVSFISDGWGGRTSDKYLTENSGLLDNLLPGDIVLADRGFTIHDCVGLYCAKLITPAFTKGKKQLSAHEEEKTRELASVRIHVERVIGNLRQKYKILHEQIPISLLGKDGSNVAPLDQIVTVCCALTNLSPSVISI